MVTAANLAQRTPSVFSVILSGVRFREDNAAKDLFGVVKIQSMLPDVRPVLRFIPFKCHCNSKCSYM